MGKMNSGYDDRATTRVARTLNPRTLNPEIVGAGFMPARNGAHTMPPTRNGEILKIILLIIFDFLIFMFIKKDSLIDMANQGLPPVESGVLVGMVLGDKTGISRDLYQLMKNSGLVHLVVASGANVMLIFGGLVEIGAMIFGRKKNNRGRIGADLVVCRNGELGNSDCSGGGAGVDNVFSSVDRAKV